MTEGGSRHCARSHPGLSVLQDTGFSPLRVCHKPMSLYNMAFLSDAFVYMDLMHACSGNGDRLRRRIGICQANHLKIPLRVMAETVAILGASINPDRYSYKVQQALIEKGHTPLPVNPRYDQIDGIQCYPDLKSLECNIDTITIYVNPGILINLTEDIIRVRPKRVIFNPGTECPEVSFRIESAGIRVQHACTLVLLNTSGFTNLNFHRRV